MTFMLTIFEILRVPNEKRRQLVYDQVKQLYRVTSDACSMAQTARSSARMLLDVEDLQKYMRDAFGVFSESLDAPFDFITASLRSQITAGFAGNISKLLFCMINI